MTPAARLQAASEIIDRINAGEAAEKSLTNWARNSRFAGSKDRRAVRDHVFDVVRMWRSTAALGGGESGRARILGLLRSTGQNPQDLFTGVGHAPAVLTEAELGAGAEPSGYAAWDLPDWLGKAFEQGLGPKAEATALDLRSRAPVYLRANLLKGTREAAQAALQEDGIETEISPLSETALQVTQGARQVARSQAYLEGLVELQDAASQAVVEVLPLDGPLHVLDYCAGGGGKTLAMAAHLAGQGRVVAHDIDPRRMKDLPARAQRAGAQIEISDDPQGPFDLVFCDAPCSGSGAWRRSPEGKWRIDPEGLQDVVDVQASILATAQALVAPDGVLAYATCSVLPVENRQQTDGFVNAFPNWTRRAERQFLPADGGDGFYVSWFSRK